MKISKLLLFFVCLAVILSFFVWITVVHAGTFTLSDTTIADFSDLEASDCVNCLGTAQYPAIVIYTGDHSGNGICRAYKTGGYQSWSLPQLFSGLFTDGPSCPTEDGEYTAVEYDAGTGACLSESWALCEANGDFAGYVDFTIAATPTPTPSFPDSWASLSVSDVTDGLSVIASSFLILVFLGSVVLVLYLLRR